MKKFTLLFVIVAALLLTSCAVEPGRHHYASPHWNDEDDDLPILFHRSDRFRHDSFRHHYDDDDRFDDHDYDKRGHYRRGYDD